MIFSIQMIHDSADRLKKTPHDFLEIISSLTWHCGWSFRPLNHDMTQYVIIIRHVELPVGGSSVVGPSSHNGQITMKWQQMGGVGPAALQFNIPPPPTGSKDTVNPQHTCTTCKEVSVFYFVISFLFVFIYNLYFGSYQFFQESK